MVLIEKHGWVIHPVNAGQKAGLKLAQIKSTII
jgi:hypothetical protein